MALTAKKVYAILKRQISDMEAKLNSPVRYRGTVATADLLPLNPDIGDMYNIESKSVYGEAGMNVAWNGVVWDTMGAPIDMSLYIKSSELADWVKQQSKPTYTANEVGALPADTKIPSKTSELKNDSGFLTKVPDGYLNGTDTTLKESGKAADAKVTGEKIAKNSSDITKKLDKNQGVENSGKIAGINESGDIVPMFPVGVEYNEKTNCLEFGSDQKMKLNQGIGLDSSLTKTGYAADAGVVGEVTNSLKEDMSNKITKFYASNQGENHLADSDNGKIQDMVIYGKSSQNKTTGKNLLKIKDTTKTVRGVTVTSKDGIITVNGTATETGWTYINIDTQILTDGTYIVNYEAKNNGPKLLLADTQGEKVIEQNVATTLSNAEIDKVCFVITKGETYNTTNVKVQLELGSSATSYEPYTGGIPSPNPDYPQEIKSVVNPTVKVCGSNIYDYENAKLTNTALNGEGIENTASGYCTSDYIPVLDGIYVKGNNNNNKLDPLRIGLYTEKNEWKIRKDITNSTLHVSSSDAKFIRLSYSKGDVAEIYVSYANIFEPYHEQTVTIPYTLNAIPVSSGGNVTIDGQQYIADYVDVERGKIIKCVEKYRIPSDLNWKYEPTENNRFGAYGLSININPNFANNTLFTHYQNASSGTNGFIMPGNIRLHNFQGFTDVTAFKEWLDKNELYAYFVKNTFEEINLTIEEIQIFKALSMYYPVTNIGVNSEQLDGYTVFNYPVSMKNGWNYVKQQLNDNRDYIYDMDLQSAEAYVNSEYAVTLTELEV